MKQPPQMLSFFFFLCAKPCLTVQKEYFSLQDCKKFRSVTVYSHTIVTRFSDSGEIWCIKTSGNHCGKCLTFKPSGMSPWYSHMGTGGLKSSLTTDYCCWNATSDCVWVCERGALVKLQQLSAELPNVSQV